MPWKLSKNHCPTCDKDYETHQPKSVYCSRECYFATREKPEARVCKQCGKDFKVRLCMIRNGWGKGIFCSAACYHAYPKSDEFKRNISEKFRGSNHPNWKGGIMKGRKERNLTEYREFRRLVFERDKYTCTDCGIKNQVGLGHTVKLEVDHIKPWATHVELRLTVSNGRTLCTDCHYKIKKETMQYIKNFRTEVTV